MARIETSIIIERPIGEVYEYVVDVENCPEWRTGCVGAKKLTQGPLGVGTQEMYKAKSMGRIFETQMEVTTYEPNMKYSWKATSGGPFPMHGWFTFEAVGKETRVAEVTEIKLAGFLRLFQPFILRMFQRQVQTDFSNLKRILETGTWRNTGRLNGR